jgi:hypothetical protein
MLGFDDGIALSETTGIGDGGMVGSNVGESDTGGSVLVMGRPVGRRVGDGFGRDVVCVAGTVVVGSG